MSACVKVFGYRPAPPTAAGSDPARTPKLSEPLAAARASSPATRASPRHPYESECDDQDHHGCEKEVCPRSPLAPRRLLSKMAGVYSHDENPVPHEEDRAKAPVIQAPWEGFSSPQAAPTTAPPTAAGSESRQDSEALRTAWAAARASSPATRALTTSPI
jgi:hypothetical protein